MFLDGLWWAAPRRRPRRRLRARRNHSISGAHTRTIRRAETL